MGIVVYLLVELSNQNLNNIFSRNIFQEIIEVGRQMVMSWSIYTVILFLQKEAHHFSRILYVTTFFVCYVCILIVRTLWKNFVKFYKRSLSPKLLIICEAGQAQTVLNIRDRLRISIQSVLLSQIRTGMLTIQTGILCYVASIT